MGRAIFTGRYNPRDHRLPGSCGKSVIGTDMGELPLGSWRIYNFTAGRHWTVS
jgi:hypothetical protein